MSMNGYVKKKKLLIITPKQFGYHIDYYNYACFLSNKYDITYLCWDYLLEKLTIPNVDINYISRAGSKFKRNVVFIRAIVKTINTTDFDCVFTNYFKGCSLLLPFIFRQRSKINIDIRTGSVKRSRWKRYIENTIIKSEASLFAHQSIISNGLKQMLKISGNAVIIPLGANKISPVQKNSKQINLIYSVAFYNRNLHQTIEGISKYLKKNPDADLNYTIIGNGDDTSEQLIAEAIAKYNLEKIIDLKGYVPSKDLIPFLKHAHIGVSYIPMTGYFQFQPATKTFEYLLAGIPTLATSTYENKLVVNDNNGVLIEDNSDSFADGLNKMICKLPKLDPLSIQKSVEEFEWKKIVEKLEFEILNKINIP